MRKYLPYILIILFPYLFVFALVCIFTGTFMDTLFNNNAFSLLFLLIILYIATFVSAIAVFIAGFAKKKNSLEVLRINMIIKLIHIPAYLLIFVFGLLCTLTIFTIGFNIVLMILDGMTIALSGLIGIGGIIRGLRENKISIKKAAMHGILQFVYCADIISSIAIYRTAKASD
jgi:hypothetical protein